MLKHFGSMSCPSCTTSLVYSSDSMSGGLPDDQSDDQRWLCPDCGYSRPVVYSVVRERRGTGRFARAMRPLLRRR